MIRAAASLLIFGILLARPGEAGQRAASFASPVSQTAPAEALELPFTFDGPPAPVPPEVIARDAVGRATIRAVRLTAPIRVDGRLDEAVYASVPPISDFIQTEPLEGSPATEKTELWVLFDHNNVYVVARCWESHPERMVVNEMRRDSLNIVQNENVAFAFDTFYDGRSSVLFEMNPLGGRIDGQVTNERQINLDWNPVWDLKVGRFEGGWTLEAAIPFKSLRYRPGRAQIWGFNARRMNRWKNEISFLTRIPASLGAGGHFRSSLMATVVGLEAPSGVRNLEIKPYAISDLTSDLTASPTISNDLGGDVGVDVKYGLTPNLTADFTYNTDFAQVEADEQQVNLTRFSLFFRRSASSFSRIRAPSRLAAPRPVGGVRARGTRRFCSTVGELVSMRGGRRQSRPAGA